MLVFVLSSLLTSGAFAQDCNGKELTAALKEATPISTANAYLDLAACDEALAKKNSAAAFEKILSGSDGNKAALAAIRLAQDETVRTWLAALEPDERSRTIASLGKTCKEDEALQGFFARAHADLGERFWEERWHRGLSDCRAEPIQKILVEAIGDKALQKEQSRFFTVLEIYARNLGKDAIPTIAALAKATDDEEQLTFMVNALADAANVGGSDGVNPVAAKAATATLVELGPKLPPRAVEQARRTLSAIGADEEADQFATHRWRDRKENNVYRYAVALIESATCKNGKSFAYLHIASFDEGGNQWPEQIQANIAEKLVFEWELESAARCKGEGNIAVEMPKQPFGSDEEAQKWLTDQKKAFSSKEGEYDKTKAIGHENFSY